MTLINAPIAEKRRWVFEVAAGLYNLQKARFGYLNAGQAREKKLAWKLVKLQQGPAYFIAISKIISEYDRNDLVNLNNYWKILLDAKEDQDFARIISDGAYVPGTANVADIDLSGNLYVSPSDTDQDQIENVIQTYSKVKKLGKLIKSAQFLGEFARYSGGFGSFIYYNAIQSHGFHTIDDRMVNTQSVPCVLGGLPLRHIQEIEVARSGKILKFRATGSVFLANQEGGEDAVRIEGLLIRSEIIFILLLWMIFYFGQGRVKELKNLQDDLSGNFHLLALRAKNTDITTFNKITQKPAYTHHFTVPFVTRHIIIPNVYIETISFEEKVVLGKGVIGYSLLLRTYRKVEEFEVYSHSPDMSFLSPKVGKSTRNFKMIEFFANAAWRYANAEGIFIEKVFLPTEIEERVIGGDGAESDDVYYNIDALPLANTTILGLIGLR